MGPNPLSLPLHIRAPVSPTRPSISLCKLCKMWAHGGEHHFGRPLCLSFLPFAHLFRLLEGRLGEGKPLGVGDGGMGLAKPHGEGDWGMGLAKPLWVGRGV